MQIERDDYNKNKNNNKEISHIENIDLTLKM